MSMTISVRSVCGATSVPMDMEDAELNEYVVCCGECESILRSRQAWLDTYAPGTRLDIPTHRDVDIIRWLHDQALKEES